MVSEIWVLPPGPGDIQSLRSSNQEVACLFKESSAVSCDVSSFVLVFDLVG